MEGALNPTLHRLLALCGLDRTWVHGAGVWLTDERGVRFLDGYAQYGAVLLGHNAPPIVEAVSAALAAGEPAMVQPYRAPHAVALADRLAALAPGDLCRCIFTTSGAESVEAAVKLVRCRSGRPLILSARGSYHGKTLAALAATGQEHHAERFGPLPSGFVHVPYGDADALESLLEQEDGRVAGLLLEPIQGERGVHFAPRGYLRQARELCSRHGVALILDEIQTGLGRTGRLFACQEEGVEPDVLLLAKGLGGGLFPLGACLSSDRWWDDHFGLRHSSTFAANNIGCCAGEAVLKALTQAGFCAEVERKGEVVLSGLKALARRHPTVIAGVRGRGLLTALELRAPTGEDGLFLSFLTQHGLYAYLVAALLAEEARLLLLPTLGRAPVLRFTPPLTISEVEIRDALDGLGRLCALLERDSACGLARLVSAPRQAALSFPPRSLPQPPARPARPTVYAFLTHPTRPADVLAANPGLEQLSPAERQRFDRAVAELPALLVLRVPPLQSATGASAEGLILTLPWLPEEMARRGRRAASEVIAQAVDLAAHCGAGVVGLGGHTTPYSRRGRAVLGRGPAITTGNALTAGMAWRVCQDALAARGQRLEEITLGVVGARGSVGGLCARLAARARPRCLLLVGNPSSGSTPLEKLAGELSWGPDTIKVSTRPNDLGACALVITASGAARPILDDISLSPGTVVCDVARPPDTSDRLRARRDITVLDGGLVALPDPGFRFGAGNLVGLPDGVQLACLSETILLALEGDTHDHGVGDDVPLAEVDAMLALADRHGFRPASLAGTAAPALLLPDWILTGVMP